jgi:ACR3 family arsenite efflux pump ArsB
MEILDSLSPRDRHVVINYLISGALFILFSYVIFYCKQIQNVIRTSIALLMLSRGFVLLSAAGKITNGYDDKMTAITQWGVVVSTLIGFFVVWVFRRWNQRMIKENNLKNE